MVRAAFRDKKEPRGTTPRLTEERFSLLSGANRVGLLGKGRTFGQIVRSRSRRAVGRSRIGGGRLGGTDRTGRFGNRRFAAGRAARHSARGTGAADRAGRGRVGQSAEETGNQAANAANRTAQNGRGSARGGSDTHERTGGTNGGAVTGGTRRFTASGAGRFGNGGRARGAFGDRRSTRHARSLGKNRGARGAFGDRRNARRANGRRNFRCRAAAASRQAHQSLEQIARPCGADRARLFRHRGTAGGAGRSRRRIGGYARVGVDAHP